MKHLDQDEHQLDFTCCGVQVTQHEVIDATLVLSSTSASWTLLASLELEPSVSETNL